MAINIKQIQHDVKKAKHPRNWEASAHELAHFLSTPVGAPFVAELTLIEAADNYSQQEPQYSDLSELLSVFSRFKYAL